MAKILRTLRNNWKKSVFLTGLSAYGIDYGQTEYKYDHITESSVLIID